MNFSFTPRGVCSRQILLDIAPNGTINNCKFIGGCAGNTTGICSLVKGMNAQEAIDRLKGIDCGGRGTSCPDQLAKALEQALEQL